eukprot:308869-Pelagomonas_calceolata.AAC.1
MACRRCLRASLIGLPMGHTSFQMRHLWAPLVGHPMALAMGQQQRGSKVHERGWRQQERLDMSEYERVRAHE